MHWKYTLRFKTIKIYFVKLFIFVDNYYTYKYCFITVSDMYFGCWLVATIILVSYLLVYSKLFIFISIFRENDHYFCTET